MDIKSIQAKAPTRIDLAGGTTDIWPLYLFLKNPVTLNMGISLFAEASLEITPATSSPSGNTGHWILKSEDQKQEMKAPWKSIDEEVQVVPGLVLHYKLLKFFYHQRLKNGFDRFDFDLTLSTRAQSPSGAGLGGSSTLSIAMIGVLAPWATQFHHFIDPQKEGERFIEIVRDIETTVIQVPAGLQDYYGAMYGGLQSLRWGVGSHHREALPSDLISELEKRIFLFYSGQSRNSGINNWALFKDFIDQKNEVREKFNKISQATFQLENSLRNRDWAAVGKAISEEWETRKTLAPGITTAEIDGAFSEARSKGQISGKVCGAGGGGCFFIYMPTPNPEIQLIFEKHGMRTLNFRGVPQGLEVKVKSG